MTHPQPGPKPNPRPVRKLLDPTRAQSDLPEMIDWVRATTVALSEIHRRYQNDPVFAKTVDESELPRLLLQVHQLSAFTVRRNPGVARFDIQQP